MSKIILITGGQRSGKSAYAEAMALRLSSQPVYVATAHVWDNEFRQRVARHQARRGPQWTTIEEELHLGRLDLTGRVVLVDCLTLWLTNLFMQNNDVDQALQLAKTELEGLLSHEATYIFVTNEIGLGGVSSNEVQRRFTDLQGSMNQHVAALADEVVMMVSGVAVNIKARHKPRPEEKSSCGGANGALVDAELIQQKIDNLNKPKGSLGRLEELAMQICLIQQTLTPSLDHPCHLLLGGDHGIEREGVSVSPREVTWQQMLNFTRGGGGVNMFCRQHGFHLRVVDVGVDHDFTGVSGIIDRKIVPGTRNFLYGPAMTMAEHDRAISVGAQLVDDCVAEGCRVISIGEMGIGNTSPSSIWMHLFGGIPLDECIGAGSGLSTPGIEHKRKVLQQAVDHYRATSPDADPVAYFGGFEMVAAIGAMLRAAERRLVVLIDGFIMTACAVAAIRRQPSVQDFMIFTHQGDESGHGRMLGLVGARPLLQGLGLRLGEGTGALCAFPIVDSAVRMMNEMGSFHSAHITKYF